MMQFRTNSQCQEIENLAKTQLALPGLLLMKRAAWQAFTWLQSLNKLNQPRLLVICGQGNNGGDGLVLAQFALLAGWQVSVFQIGETLSSASEALAAKKDWLALGGKIEPYHPLSFTKALSESDWIVDALFGIHLNREIEGDAANAIQQINQSQASVLALDIASGIYSNTGQVCKQTIQADFTATFICPKLGTYLADGKDYSGEIAIFDLNLPPSLVDSVASTAKTQTLQELSVYLPKRKHNSHKGTYGCALLVGGNSNMMGAIQLASKAALYAGAGLVKVATQANHQMAICAQEPELMVFDATNLAHLLTNTQTVQAIAIGPGLGQDAWATTLWHEVMASTIPLVVDADALNILAKQPKHAANWVLTPHPTEAARLLNCDTQTIQANRILASQKLHQKYGGVIVLKGAGTVVYDGNNCFICTSGNPSMAVGGMGDVLTGIITSLIAQKMPLYQAACLAVQWHAQTADEWIKHNSKNSITPSNLILNLIKL